MATLNFTLDPETVTLDQMCNLEEVLAQDRSALQIRDIRSLLAGFVCDDSGTLLSSEAGTTVVGAMSLRDIMQALDAMGSSLEAVKQNAVPPRGGGSS